MTAGVCLQKGAVVKRHSPKNSAVSNKNLNVSDCGLVNWCEKLWKAIEAVWLNNVDGLLGVAGSFR